MLIERQRWLVLLCLPLLAASTRHVHAQPAVEPADDFLTTWRAFSDAARDNAPPDVRNADTPFPSLAVSASGNDTPRQPSLLSPPSLDGSNASLSVSDAEDPSANLWEQPTKKPRKVSQKSEGLLGSLNTQVEVTDAPLPSIWDDPSWKRTWQTNESWQFGLSGPLSVFGQVGANSDEAGTSNMKVSGRTGLAWKVPVGSLAEFTFRSGPGVSYTDPLHPVRQGRSDWLLEVQGRWPLLFGVGLEYQGTATPSLTPMQQDTLNQDLRLAFPVGNAGKLKVGAKHQRTGMLDQRSPWADNMQLYLGLELTR